MLTDNERMDSSPAPNETIYGTEYGMKFCDDKDAINALLVEPAEVPAWGDWLYNHELYAADGVPYMQENTQAVWVEPTTKKTGGDWYPQVREEYGNLIY